MQRFDAVIVGDGPAGLSAALNLKIREKRFLLFGSGGLSRKVAAAQRVDNYLGLPHVTGGELRGSFQKHLDQMGIAVTAETVQMVYPMGGYFSLNTAKDIYEAASVILAPGAFSAKLLPGEGRLLGCGVSYCATCDAPLYRGRVAAVLGYTAEAAQEAQFLAQQNNIFRDRQTGSPRPGVVARCCSHRRRDYLHGDRHRQRQQCRLGADTAEVFHAR